LGIFDLVEIFNNIVGDFIRDFKIFKLFVFNESKSSFFSIIDSDIARYNEVFSDGNKVKTNINS
jgi:hypothetical protein